MRYKVFIFDLDGTLIDTSPGIIATMRSSEAALGLSPAPDDSMRIIIGPPIAEGMRLIHPELSEDKLPELVRKYRDIYADTGMFNAVIYPNLRETLDMINAAGAKAAVDTAKIDYITKQVLEHFGLDDRFAAVAAVTDSMNDKAVLVRRVLQETGCAPDEAVVIGDSHYDGDAAKRAGVDFIAALYGFGFESEEDAAEFAPVACAKTTGELYALVDGYLRQGR